MPPNLQEMGVDKLMTDSPRDINAQNPLVFLRNGVGLFCQAFN